jgi:hypothetical protein
MIMKFPKREDYIETIEYNGTIYSSVNEDAWLHALKLYNRKKNQKEHFEKRRFKTIKINTIHKLLVS